MRIHFHLCHECILKSTPCVELMQSESLSAEKAKDLVEMHTSFVATKNIVSTTGLSSTFFYNTLMYSSQIDGDDSSALSRLILCHVTKINFVFSFFYYPLRI